MSEPHIYQPRPGLDWCAACGLDAHATIHALDTMVHTERGWEYPSTAPDYPILGYFSYEHLEHPFRQIAQRCCSLAHEMAEDLPHTPEVSAGLRKLLEAQDCFLRARQ